MIESVSTLVNISPLPDPLTQQQPLLREVNSDQQPPKDADSPTNAAAPVTTMAETDPEKDLERVSELVDAVQDSMEKIQQKNNHLLFSVHEKTDQVMVRVTNQESGEVIREIPSQEFLDLAAKFEQMVGLMFDMKI